jgi:hypothetical protein
VRSEGAKRKETHGRSGMGTVSQVSLTSSFAIGERFRVTLKGSINIRGTLNRA